MDVIMNTMILAQSTPGDKEQVFDLFKFYFGGF